MVFRLRRFAEFNRQKISAKVSSEFIVRKNRRELMDWWIWVVAGLVLLALEIMIPMDFVLVFVGLAGVATGILAGIGVISLPWLQWSVFAVLSLFLLLIAKKPLVQHLKLTSRPLGTELTEGTVEISEDIAVGEKGNGTARGSVWTVENKRDEILEKGKAYKVTDRDGLTLIVGK